VRLVVDWTNKGTNQNQLFVTELQYTEAPPVIIPTSPNFPLGHPSSPRVVFLYAVQGTGQVAQGNGNARVCQIQNLSTDVLAEFPVGPLANPTTGVLALPLLGAWHKFTVVGRTATQLTVNLDDNPVSGRGSWPDPQLGAAGGFPANPKQPQPARQVYVTYHFGLYASPRPLLGEPTLQLPRDICIDLTPLASDPAGVVSPPPLTPPFRANDYDVVFAPSGQVLPFGTSGNRGVSGQIFLWVRNLRKGPGPGSVGNWSSAGFAQGGEQQLVSIKAKSGALGVHKVRWPDNMAGAAATYNFPLDPYTYARQGADEAQ